MPLHQYSFGVVRFFFLTIFICKIPNNDGLKWFACWAEPRAWRINVWIFLFFALFNCSALKTNKKNYSMLCYANIFKINIIWFVRIHMMAHCFNWFPSLSNRIECEFVCVCVCFVWLYFFAVVIACDGRTNRLIPYWDQITVNIFVENASEPKDMVQIRKCTCIPKIGQLKNNVHCWINSIFPFPKTTKKNQILCIIIHFGIFFCVCCFELCTLAYNAHYNHCIFHIFKANG